MSRSYNIGHKIMVASRKLGLSLERVYELAMHSAPFSGVAGYNRRCEGYVMMIEKNTITKFAQIDSVGIPDDEELLERALGYLKEHLAGEAEEPGRQLRLIEAIENRLNR